MVIDHQQVVAMSQGCDIRSGRRFTKLHLNNWTKSYLINCTMGRVWVNRPRQIPKSEEWELGAYRGRELVCRRSFLYLEINSLEWSDHQMCYGIAIALSSSTKLSHLNRPVWCKGAEVG